ncbi:MAG: hypothetical protein ACR2RB_18390 [Gammaproteobacteria bacterium]
MTYSSPALEQRIEDIRETLMASSWDETNIEEYIEKYSAGWAEGVEKGAREERERCQAIIGSSAAARDPLFARFVATKTDLPVDAAVELLETAPLRGPRALTLAEKMAAAGTPMLGPDIIGEGGKAERLIAAHRAVRDHDGGAA